MTTDANPPNNQNDPTACIPVRLSNGTAFYNAGGGGGPATTVDIDQTTPGVTNGVQVNAALPAGTNLIGQVEVTDGTNVLGTSAHPVIVQGAFGGSFLLVTSQTSGSATGGLAGSSSDLAGGIFNTSLPTLTNGQQASIQLDSSGRLINGTSTAVIGKVGIDQTTPGTTNGVAVVPLPVTPTDRGGTLTTGGTAQNAMASNASRKGGWIQNDTAATETLYVSVTGAATVGSSGNSAALAPGQSFSLTQEGLVITAAVSVNATTTSHRWNAVETQ